MWQHSAHAGCCRRLGRLRGALLLPPTPPLPAQLAARLLGGVGAGWAARVFYTDDGSTAVEVALKMAFRRFMADRRLLGDEAGGVELQVGRLGAPWGPRRVARGRGARSKARPAVARAEGGAGRVPRAAPQAAAPTSSHQPPRDCPGITCPRCWA